MAQVKARSWMPGSPRKAADWMMPLLMVSARDENVSTGWQSGNPGRRRGCEKEAQTRTYRRCGIQPRRRLFNAVARYISNFER